MLTGLGVIAETDQQIDQLQAQAIVFGVGRQQQLGIVGRDGIRFTAIMEHFFALKRRPQQATHGDRTTANAHGLSRRLPLVTEALVAEELTMTHLLHR
jgi:hypothetical protein